MSVVIDNIGPIEHLELDAKPGTITVLRGMNGEGKSTALEAISAITRGTEKLESRDGTTGGKATGFGVQIKVGRGGANRRTGDLVVTAVEDRLSIADFVDPGLKNQFAADAKRLKALVSLAGVVADPTLFHSLVGGVDAFKDLVKPDSLKATDPITLAENIKRDFEAASRIQTTRAERLFGEITAKLSSNEGLDLAAESDAGVLQRRLEMWLAEQSTLNERLRLSIEGRRKRAEAQAALDKAAAETGGFTLAEAKVKAEEAKSAVLDAEAELFVRRSKVDELRKQLTAAESAVTEYVAVTDKCRDWAKSAAERIELIQQRESTLGAWWKTLEAPAIAEPSAEALASARQAVEEARKAHEQGVLIRAASQRKREADALEADRKAAVDRAAYLREAALSVFDTLAETVKGLVPGLKLDPELRIIVPHAKRGQCFYSDLSHGERWKLALDIAVATFERRNEPGVLAIPQEAWEGLDGRNRKVIADHVATTDLVVFTAECERSVTGADSGIAVDVLQGGAA